MLIGLRSFANLLIQGRMTMKGFVLGLAVPVVFLGLGVSGALAQAPAGAPAGATGICKDGTYSMAASKSGACRGHNGVQTWYVPATTGAAKSTPAAPAPTPAKTAPAAMPAPTPAKTAPAAAPAPTPQAAATTGKKLSPEQQAATKTAAPGGAPGLVWVNTSSNVYHCYGDAFYGKTKAGKYMSEADAKAAGAHGDHGKSCSAK
jgi:hypothetical protein